MKRHKSNYNAIVLLLPIHKPKCLKITKLSFIFFAHWFFFAKCTQRLSKAWHDENFFSMSLRCEVTEILIQTPLHNFCNGWKKKSHTQKSYFDIFHRAKAAMAKWMMKFEYGKGELIIALIKNKSSKIWRLKFAEAYFHATVNNNNKRGMRQKGFLRHREKLFSLKKWRVKTIKKAAHNKNINLKFNFCRMKCREKGFLFSLLKRILNDS